MAGTDSQKQLLTLIRDFASENSQGERRVIGLKKRIDELRSHVDASNTELEESKRLKEMTEQELKGYEVELALNDASIQALEARISLIQDEISSVGSQVENLKNEEAASRDKFIGMMFDINTRIRKFHETIAGKMKKENSVGTLPEGDNVEKKFATEVDSRSLEDMLSHIVSQTTKEEEEYMAEKNIQRQVQQEYADIQRKVSLIEMIMKETKALQDLTRQTAEFEEACAFFGEELQKRCICPSCQIDNAEALGGVLQATEAN